jgi:hypothetical protein
MEKRTRIMSIVVFFIVLAFWSWFEERNCGGKVFTRICVAGWLAWIVSGFFFPDYSIDAFWSQFLQANHAAAETRAERPDALDE